MTLVKNILPHHRVADPVDCGEDMEVMTVHFEIGDFLFGVYNVYRESKRQLEANGLLSLACHSNVVLAGDFNAHQPLLQSVSPTNPADSHLATVLEEVPDVVLLNSGKPTHVRGGRLDLTMMSQVLAHGATL